MVHPQQTSGVDNKNSFESQKNDGKVPNLYRVVLIIFNAELTRNPKLTPDADGHRLLTESTTVT